MKRKIAKALVLVLVLSMGIVYAPKTQNVDVVSAATNSTSTPTTPTTPVKTTPTTTTPSAPVIEAGSQVYTVVNGDVLWKIAKKFNLTLDELLALNPQIKNKNLIHVGQKIVVGKAAPAASTTTGSVKVYQGMGQSVAFRTGPGKDAEGVQVYSFNIVMANVTFDAQGKILNAYIDAYEVSTPNYDGASMPHFSGWPGKEGYNISSHAAEGEEAKVTGVSENTPESIAAEVNGWKTKRERGDSYGMNPANDWYKQMDFYQKFFVGKTIAELKEWIAKNTGANGRPIKANTTKQDELDKLAKLTDAEKAQLADVVSGATMSLSDAHGDFIGALEDAYNNRVEVTIPVK